LQEPGVLKISSGQLTRASQAVSYLQEWLTLHLHKKRKANSEILVITYEVKNDNFLKRDA
jgi:hypothetical protein